MDGIPTYLSLQSLAGIYPYNVAIAVLGDETDLYGRTPGEVAAEMTECSAEKIGIIHEEALTKLKRRFEILPIYMFPISKSFSDEMCEDAMENQHVDPLCLSVTELGLPTRAENVLIALELKR